jgi:hypothetical protein
MHQMCMSTTEVSSVMLRSKTIGNPKQNEKTERAVGWNPNSAMKLSQIRQYENNICFW